MRLMPSVLSTSRTGRMRVGQLSVGPHATSSRAGRHKVTTNSSMRALTSPEQSVGGKCPAPESST